MTVDEQGGLQIRSLVFPGRVLEANLHHTVAVVALVAVHPQREVAAVHIDSLSLLVVVVEAVLADLDLDAAGLVLDVETLVEVARTVSGADYAGDDYVLVHHPRRTGLVLVRELRNRMRGRHLDRLHLVGIVVSARNYRLKLLPEALARAEGENGREYCDDK